MGQKGEVLIVFGGKVVNGDVASLTVAVQTPVALFQTGRIPRDVPV
jgi:hypothetical protein